MGSLLPILDLNASPNPSQPATAAAAVALKVPKIEPKAEPYDDPMPPPQTTPQPPLDLFPNPQITPPVAPQITPPVVPAADQDTVYSEFHRIQELFHTAFAKGIQNCDGGGGGGCDEDGVVLDPESGAIVPVEDASQKQQLAEVVQRKKYPQRSNELVRVTDLREEDHRYFREVVRKTRMLYDSIRINSIAEEDRKNPGQGKRTRGDLRAASVLRDRGLWLNRDKRIVGSIPGVYVGDLFFFRMELCVVGIHGQVQAGIDYLPGSQSSNREPIATSIIVSGGYEDDEDAGDVIIYTGHGGQDKFNKQCAHQKLEGGNLALERSMHYGIEVRVIRGRKIQSVVSQKVYVYDGLYRILETWLDVGKSGFGVYKFKLLRIEGQPEMGSSILKFAESLRTKPLTVRPRGYLSLDLSQQREKIPVRLFNDIDADQDPLYYEYLRAPAFPTHVYHQSANGTGCECVNGCNQNCICAMKNGGEFPYDQNGFLLRGKPVVFECGSFCRCPPSCRNRVTQNGMKHRLEVFRSRETGWGVRSLDLIHAGAFICEYAGVILTREQAHIFSMDGDSLIYPHRFADKWAEWGDLSQIYPDYVRPTYPAIPPLDFAMDVSKMRNVACYMSQSSTPNVMVQFVLYDHNNLMFPHLMLFAMENIPPMRELSLDYGVAVADEWTGKLAICN
ncbi:PREDICTED: histone-lysine N-methyltransferase family member SUVH9-like [Fragaria vesca subsp. vesca]|uniref:histone-lysine N-methyltransferase family member SUVH9-like n=1 Tax=Fragaria vesca subsp. vesca TaxID=101020 RepID=UPI0002C2FAAB|nr:PREDICTED: histone-lysine N-methyltransferase family member SUVH9-like [Fragaria vesca subsp. vesca]